MSYIAIPEPAKNVLVSQVCATCQVRICFRAYSLSGIPMGLGAGFKIIDKDKSSSSNDKDRDREKDKAKERDRDYDKPRSKHKDKEEGHKHRKSVDDSPLPESPMSPHSGWTSAIENWLCNGSGSQSTANLLMTPGEARESPKATKSHSTTEIPQRTASKEARKGPYQLLIKERMMGIYLAVYIHRDLRGSVKGRYLLTACSIYTPDAYVGTSRSAVTAGLIGGRVGNKVRRFGGLGWTCILTFDIRGELESASTSMVRRFYS